jgi:hexaprenyl-diphosphate synthase
VDDILDYTSSDEALGKTGNGSDLKAGLITAPGLYAWKEHGGAFGELVSRKFVRPGDLELV